MATSWLLDAVVSGRWWAGVSEVGLFTWLRPRLPFASFAVVAEDWASSGIVALSDFGVGSYVLWRDVDDPGLGHHLLAIAEGRLVVVPKPVGHAY